MKLDVTSLPAALADVNAMIADAIAQEIRQSDLGHEHLREAAFAYLERGGKRLRPLVTVLATGAAGGDPDRVRSAALAVEVFHTWTLIHDDMIDNDARRRGGPTVHVAFRDRLRHDFPSAAHRADIYGNALAILAGDYMQGLAVRLILDGTERDGVPPETARQAARFMQTDLLRDLVEGEMWDVGFSFRPVLDVSEEALLEMYRQKSAALLSYCARVGGMYATGGSNDDTVAAHLADFAEQCGVAFQIRDDVLGVVGDAERLGKPVGSDVREGKRTVILRRAYEAATEAERAHLDAVVGNRSADHDQVAGVVEILRERGGLQHADAIADRYVETALTRLQAVEPSAYRDRLEDWARHLITRDV